MRAGVVNEASGASISARCASAKIKAGTRPAATTAGDSATLDMGPSALRVYSGVVKAVVVYHWGQAEVHLAPWIGCRNAS
jgi:hypothetical protein